MRRPLMAAVAVVALGAAGCGDDPSDVSSRDLVGLWGAISMEYTGDADGERVDLVGTEGATYSLQLYSAGQYESQLSWPRHGITVEEGTYEVRGGRLILSAAGGGDRSLGIDFNGSLLTLTEPETEWVFQAGGEPVPATLVLVLDRF